MLSGMHDISESESHSVVSDSLGPHGPYSPWNSPGQNIGMGSFSLLQGIFPTQELNLGLPHCRQILYQLSHKGSPRILEWVAYPFSSRSFRPRNWTRVSYTAGKFFTTWAISGKPGWYKVSADSASLISHLLLLLLLILHWHSINMLKWTELCLKVLTINYFNSFCCCCCC